MTMVMTSAVGKFTFEDDVQLSHAKLVRDSVVGQMLAPKTRTMRVETEDEAYAFIRAYESDVISKIAFELELSFTGEKAAFQRAVLDLSRYSRVTSRQVLEMAKKFEMASVTIFDMIAVLRMNREMT